MNNLTNYHSHSTYCDGHATVEEFILQAIAEGYYSYGFSSHAPLPFSTSWNMDWSKMDEYIAELTRLKEKYKSQIELYIGLEIDYLSDEFNPSIPQFSNLPLDYSIGSVHLLELDSGEFVDIDTGAELFAEQVVKYFNSDYEEVIYRYFDAMRKLIKTASFDFLGHCDKISKNSSYCVPGICESSFYKKMIRAYFEFVAESGCLIEVNTKAYEVSGMLFPNESNFKLMRELEIPVVVNSDSHRLEKIGSGRKEALQALVQAHFTTVYELHQGQWVSVPICKSMR